MKTLCLLTWAVACTTLAYAADIKIVTTTTDLADITRAIAGDVAEVEDLARLEDVDGEEFVAQAEGDVLGGLGDGAHDGVGWDATGGAQ